MIVIGIPDRELEKDLENVLVLMNGENYHGLTSRYISRISSNDFRKPTFVTALSDSQIVWAAACQKNHLPSMWGGKAWVSNQKTL